MLSPASSAFSIPVSFTAFSNDWLSTVGASGVATVKKSFDVAASESNTLLDAFFATTCTL